MWTLTPLLLPRRVCRECRGLEKGLTLSIHQILAANDAMFVRGISYGGKLAGHPSNPSFLGDPVLAFPLPLSSFLLTSWRSQ